ncbi:MAG: DUF5615 family PIN-like protein [Candidatus Bathyarchaeia archaeon]|jgi:predicted nuclease of predicted toxin-antitoxin system
MIVDENVPRDVREWLSKKGFEIINVSQIHLKGAKDHVIAEYAAKNKIAIVTLDRGFAQVYRTFQKGTLTVMIIKANPPTPINIIETLNSAQVKLNLKEIENKLVIITKKKIRIIG